MKKSSYIFNLFFSTKIVTKNFDRPKRSIRVDIYKDLNLIVGAIYGDKDIKSYEDLIASYENNQDIIETLDYSLSPELSNAYLRLISEYALSLSVVDNHKKAVQYLDKAIFLYETKYSKELFKSKTYEFLLWHRGKCNFSLRNFELAKTDFDILVKHYPENGIYHKWVDEFANIKLRRINNIFYILLIISVVVSFFKSNLLLQNISFWSLSIVGGLILVTEIILYNRRHKSIA